MAIQRITISVQPDLAKKLKRASRGGTVSAWVTSLIEERLRDDELDKLWQQYLRDNPPDAAATRSARALHKRLTRKRRPRSAA